MSDARQFADMVVKDIRGGFGIRKIRRDIPFLNIDQTVLNVFGVDEFDFVYQIQLF